MMQSISCDSLTERISAHLQKGFEAHTVSDGCVIVTPYLHSDFTHIEFLVETRGQNLYLTDEGETVANLFVNGLSVDGNKALLLEIARLAKVHRVLFQNFTLFVEAPVDRFGEAAQCLINAIQSVTFLIYRRSHRQYPTFDDEVEKLLLEYRVKYEKNRVLRGASTSHRIPYYLNSNLNVFLQPVTATSAASAKNKASDLAFQWTDLEKAQIHGNFTVLIDDRKDRWGKVWSNTDALVILEDYSTNVIRWETERFRLTQLVTGHS